MSALTMRTIQPPGPASRRTSMRLEPEFWSALDDIARAQGVTVSSLVAGVPGAGNWTSAVRVHVLRHYRDAAGLGEAPRAQPVPMMGGAL